MLAAAAEHRDVKDSGGLNIEALELSLDQQRLLIGFRSPLHDGRAIIASVQNPQGIFEAGQEPRVATALDELDLGGHGIRGLSYVPSLGEYLVIAVPFPARMPSSIFGSGAVSKVRRRAESRSPGCKAWSALKG